MKVTTDEWRLLYELALTRDKPQYASSRYWNPTSHFHGLVGEWVYGKMIGAYPHFSADPRGDDGTDFPGVDVKTSTFPDPDLKLTGKNVAPAYVLMHLGVAAREVRYMGWARAEDFTDMTRARTMDFGNGPVLAIHWSNLRPGMPL